jgi:hypothetical protein
MTRAVNWRHVATAILILATLVILFYVLGAPITKAADAARQRHNRIAVSATTSPTTSGSYKVHAATASTTDD